MLRSWQVEDARWYVESRDEEVFRWTEEDRNLTINAAETEFLRVNGDRSLHCFAIADDQTGELLGNITLTFKGKDPGSAEINYWLAPWGRGRGIGANAVNLVCEWAFDTFGLHRITLKTQRGNTRSQRVAERAYFRPDNVPAEDELKEDPLEAGLVDYVWFERTRD